MYPKDALGIYMRGVYVLKVYLIPPKVNTMFIQEATMSIPTTQIIGVQSLFSEGSLLWIQANFGDRISKFSTNVEYWYTHFSFALKKGWYTGKTFLEIILGSYSRYVVWAFNITHTTPHGCAKEYPMIVLAHKTDSHTIYGMVFFYLVL